MKQQFRPLDDWLQENRSKRISVSYAAGLNEQALTVCLRQGVISDFDTAFCIDVKRTLLDSTLSQEDKSKVRYFISQPISWEGVLESVREIKNSMETGTNTAITINDWQTMLFLYSQSSRFHGVTPKELLLELSLLEEGGNLLLLRESSDQGEQERGFLLDWSNANVEIAKSGQATRSSMGSIPSSIQWQDREQNSPAGPKAQVPQSSQDIDSALYDELLGKLGQAQSREQLFEVRKEIQSQSESLSMEQKAALSDIYKIHLQRVKLLEDNAGSNSHGQGEQQSYEHRVESNV